MLIDEHGLHVYFVFGLMKFISLSTCGSSTNPPRWRVKQGVRNAWHGESMVGARTCSLQMRLSAISLRSLAFQFMPPNLLRLRSGGEGRAVERRN